MSKRKMCNVIALVTLLMPVAPEDAVAGEKVRSLLPGSALTLDADTAAELVIGKSVAYATDEEAATLLQPAILEGAALHQAIGQAMRDVDFDEGLTAEGKVSLYALESLLGFKPSAEDRDAAHEIYAGKRGNLFPDGATSPGRGPDDFIVSVALAIKQLDRENKSFWTKGGLPDLRALTEELGRKVTEEDRTAAQALIASETA